MPQFVLGQFTEFIAWMLDSLLSLYFWIIKIMATTVGETGADYLAVHVGLGTMVEPI